MLHSLFLCPINRMYIIDLSHIILYFVYILRNIMSKIYDYSSLIEVIGGQNDKFDIPEGSGED